MPSWNEKSHVIPSINVNLKPCDCASSATGTHAIVRRARGEYEPLCSGAPILVPLPLEPWQSVTFTVRLGECQQVGCVGDTRQDGHAKNCPARPIRVTCSISGKTWEESEVTEVEVQHEGRETSPADILHACRARWRIFKALALGKSPTFDVVPAGAPNEVLDLFPQRDAVFAALADMARCERDCWSAAQAIHKVLPDMYVSSDMQVVNPGDEDGDCPSARWLAAYVERLIEQVGFLP